MSDALELELQGGTSLLPPTILLETKLCFVNHKISICSSALSRLSSPYSYPPAISLGHPSALFHALATVLFFLSFSHIVSLTTYMVVCQITKSSRPGIPCYCPMFSFILLTYYLYNNLLDSLFEAKVLAVCLSPSGGAYLCCLSLSRQLSYPSSSLTNTFSNNLPLASPSQAREPDHSS